jgi:iron(III) transport system substrate-binding protein
MKTRKLTLFVLMLTLMLLPVVAFAANSEIVVYTHANDHLHADVVKAFEKKHPDIKVKTVSTGDSMVERAIAEKANPQADVIYGVGDFELDQMMNAGVLEPYRPKGNKVPAKYIGPDDFYVGHYFELLAIAINTDVLKQKGLPVPTGWADLGRPQYKGLLSLFVHPSQPNSCSQAPYCIENKYN